MLSLSVSCYFTVRKKSREISMMNRPRRNNSSSSSSNKKRMIAMDWALRSLVVAPLLLIVLGLFKLQSLPAVIPNLLGKSFFLRQYSPEVRSKAVNSNVIGFGVREAQVDITMKEMYDEIKFENVHGGAWTQGWDVQYNGKEWDEEKLRVFVVPHSHNDPGWLRTFEEYYQERTRNILSNIVKTLSKDSRRRFIWEEVSYLKRWWADALQWEREEFVRLAKNGQIEIVGGGWVMNDEANSHYYAIIEQMVAGNMWLLDNIGVKAKNAWSIDPFGHSSTMPYLLKRMGFQSLVIQRTHYEVKKALALKKNLEFFWRQSWDSGNTTDLLTHMMPFYFYDIPHTCGPQPAVCCQFDFWRIPGYSDVLPCPWGIHPQSVSSANVKSLAQMLLDQYRKKSVLYRTNTLLVPLGDDFRYASSKEGELQFENYQRLFDYINTNGELRADVRFGTLEEYFTALRRTESGVFPTLAGDFFTYADRMDDYWSGYYTTRPVYKATDRVLEETLRAADILFFFAHVQGVFRDELARCIVSARENLALFQHHDGVTGTARGHVVEDYTRRMQDSILCLRRRMSFPPMNYLAVDSKSLVEVTDNHLHRVTIFNPLATSVDHVVTVTVDITTVCVLDKRLGSVKSQITPEWRKQDATATGRNRLQWEARLPGLGHQTYFVVSSRSFSSCTEAVLAELRVSDRSYCPQPYECTLLGPELVVESGGDQSIGFSRENGMLRWIRQESGTVTVEEEVMWYSSSGSGAYLFRPAGEASTLLETDGGTILSRGPIMEEVFVLPRSKLGDNPVSRSARVFKSKTLLEMEYHVDLSSVKYDNKEIVCRFKTGIDNGRVFYSDSNGYQTIRRETYDKIPLQGNYYPMPSLALLQGDNGWRMSVHSRQAAGVASLGNGWLEIMLDRRIPGDDGRGLGHGHGITDNKPLDIVFHVLLEKNVSRLPDPSSSAPRLPSVLSHLVSAQLNYRPVVFTGKPDTVKPDVFERNFLRMDFPCDMHLVNLKVLRPTSGDRDEYGLTILRRGWDDSYGRVQGCKTLDERGLDMFSVFKDVVVKDMMKSTINFVQEQSREFGYIVQGSSRKEGLRLFKKNGLLDLAPMEIQAFKFSAV